MGDLIDLPPNHRSLDLNRHREGEQAEDVAAEVWDLKRSIWIVVNVRHAES